jgi:hypothetical protein
MSGKYLSHMELQGNPTEVKSIRQVKVLVSVRKASRSGISDPQSSQESHRDPSLGTAREAAL